MNMILAAFGLDEGESLNGLLAQGPPAPALAHQFVDLQGFVWLAQEDFINADVVEPVKAKILYAVQQPLAATAGAAQDIFRTGSRVGRLTYGDGLGARELRRSSRGTLVREREVRALPG
jgi:hypothetical protein